MLLLDEGVCSLFEKKILLGERVLTYERRSINKEVESATGKQVVLC